METIKVNFKDCSREYLEDTFGLVQLMKYELLINWIEKSTIISITDFEKETVNRLQEKLVYRVDDWNEMELIEHFIAPLMALIDYNSYDYAMFMNRELSSKIDNILLTGNPDAIIAKGRRSPKIPYFCFNEYKKELEAKGEPIGQCLAAMLVAQELNNNERPIYGVVVKGKMWEFLVLKGKEYAISNAYKSTDEELFEIVKLLKHLKTIIDEYVKS